MLDSVGSTVLLRIGDLSSEQRPDAFPEHEVATFNSLRIDRVTTQLLKVDRALKAE